MLSRGFTDCPDLLEGTEGPPGPGFKPLTQNEGSFSPSCGKSCRFSNTSLWGKCRKEEELPEVPVKEVTHRMYPVSSEEPVPLTLYLNDFLGSEGSRLHNGP